MAVKMWAGRTAGATDKLADDFNSSISFDSRMYRQDIKGSMAHAAMLGAKGIISQDEADTLISGLDTILNDIESGELPINMECEDIHMFVEQVLTERLGDVGKKLHTARSRNDQVALDLRMNLREETETIIDLIRQLFSSMILQIKANKTTIMPGYTHLQRAQPITFAQHLLAYCMMLLRDIDRFKDMSKRMNMSPIGCCAFTDLEWKKSWTNAKIWQRNTTQNARGRLGICTFSPSKSTARRWKCSCAYQVSARVTHTKF